MRHLDQILSQQPYLNSCFQVLMACLIPVLGSLTRKVCFINPSALVGALKSIFFLYQCPKLSINFLDHCIDTNCSSDLEVFGGAVVWQYSVESFQSTAANLRQACVSPQPYCTQVCPKGKSTRRWRQQAWRVLQGTQRLILCFSAWSEDATGLALVSCCIPQDTDSHKASDFKMTKGLRTSKIT